jgi:hypothetical protein
VQPGTLISIRTTVVGVSCFFIANIYICNSFNKEAMKHEPQLQVYQKTDKWLQLAGSLLFDIHHVAYILILDLLAALCDVTGNCNSVSSQINCRKDVI